MLRIAFTIMFRKRIFSAEFFQHAILEGKLLDAKKELKLYKIKFASKCSALSKASKPCEDSKNSDKEADKIIANEHPNDIIDVK